MGRHDCSATMWAGRAWCSGLQHKCLDPPGLDEGSEGERNTIMIEILTLVAEVAVDSCRCPRRLQLQKVSRVEMRTICDESCPPLRCDQTAAAG